jgi:hypothetical protein
MLSRTPSTLRLGSRTLLTSGGNNVLDPYLDFDRTLILFLSVAISRVSGMSALGEEAIGPAAADPFAARLDEILEELAAVVADTSAVADLARIDRLTRLEKLRAATAALQAAESVKFAQSQVAEQLAAGVHPEAIGRGIAEQIGLACRISPATAARRLNTARALWFELPGAYRQLVAGELSERSPNSLSAKPGTSTRRSAVRWIRTLSRPGLAEWGSKPPPPVSARSPTRPTGKAMCDAAVPNANIAVSASDRHPTPWRY